MTFKEFIEKKYRPRSVVGHAFKVEFLEWERDFAEWKELWLFLKLDLRKSTYFINGARTVWAAYQYHVNGKEVP